MNKYDPLTIEQLEELLKVWDVENLISGQDSYFIDDDICKKYYGNQKITESVNKCDTCPLQRFKENGSVGCMDLFESILKEEIMMDPGINTMTWHVKEDIKETYGIAYEEITAIRKWILEEIANKKHMFEF
jgi:hypothetical protein